MKAQRIIKECQCLPVNVARCYETVSSTDVGISKGRPSSYFMLVHAITGSGMTGVGEMSDLPTDQISRFREASHLTGKPLADVRNGTPLPGMNVAELSREIESALIGQDPFDVKHVLQEFREAHATELAAGDVYYTKAAWAISMVMYDMMGKMLNTPVYELFGGKIRDRLPISWVAYIRPAEFLEDEIEQRLSQGFRAFKLKVGGDPELDMERVGTVRRIAGPDVTIKVDAMASWTVDEAIERIRQLEIHNLLGVETPVSYTEPGKTAAVRSAINVPVIEHIYNAAYGMGLWTEDAVDVLNIMPTMTNGMDQASNFLSLAEVMGRQAVLGSDVELGPGTAAALHLGVSSPAVTFPSDLVGPGLYVDDVITEPFQYDDGCLVVRNLPGLGVKLDLQKARSWECTPESVSEVLDGGHGGNG